ncbi:hypothetical protein PRUPE_5G064800 [Prunus persica]|uniref:Uncharacterized protein n=1 Tax=Prunus persica TaxID=3760 RepID=A0A251P4N3_PRUPE|nr:hypothetical protein PRUPE_5G064800 [Prunus persica]ONI06502.1 hypothetical protein PRUPE_5G064800 [Prunus persica]
MLANILFFNPIQKTKQNKTKQNQTTLGFRFLLSQISYICTYHPSLTITPRPLSSPLPLSFVFPIISPP